MLGYVARRPARARPEPGTGSRHCKVCTCAWKRERGRLLSSFRIVASGDDAGAGVVNPQSRRPVHTCFHSRQPACPPPRRARLYDPRPRPGLARSSGLNGLMCGYESFFILTRRSEFKDLRFCVELVCRVLNRTASPNNGCTLYLLSFEHVLLYPTPQTTERRHPDERRCTMALQGKATSGVPDPVGSVSQSRDVVTDAQANPHSTSRFFCLMAKRDGVFLGLS